MPFDIGKQTIGVVLRDPTGSLRDAVIDAVRQRQPLFLLVRKDRRRQTPKTRLLARLEDTKWRWKR